MAITFHNDGSDFRLPAKRVTAAWVRSCVERRGLRCGDISFIFCSAERQLELNRTFLGHDYPTDVITFDYGELDGAANGPVSGDIFIDPETVAANARQWGAAPLDEMRRVVIHGVLHLCGLGDKTPAQRKRMRAEEDECLALFPCG